MGITGFLAAYITAFIDRTGYITVFICMVMESMVLPVPSEAVMPFAGFLVSDGRFSFLAVIIIGTAGSMVGSIISYCIGRFGGEPFINKFGKYILIDKEELDYTAGFFKKHGEIAVFICRFIPVVRHLISIPAGLGKMNFARFCIFTAIGAFAWNTILTIAGFYLRKNWVSLMKYSRAADIVFLVIILAMIIFYVVRHLKKRVLKKPI